MNNDMFNKNTQDKSAKVVVDYIKSTMVCLKGVLVEYIYIIEYQE